ncbi:MAG: SUMF1/EgtB/PvdO family nonheme iron enzyme [Verrucomicrobiota bacterium]
MRQLPLALILVLACCGERQEPKKLTERGKRIAAMQDPDPVDRPAPEEVIESEPELRQTPYFALTEAIHALITEEPPPLSMEPYAESVPLADDASFEMVPVPGGSFTIGTPEAEAGRRLDEGPQVRVEISPFWIGKHEVTWEIYRAFMENGSPRNRDGTPDRDGNPMTSEAPEIGDQLVDAVAQPPPPDTPMHFEMGQGYGVGWPAIAMSQHAASKFCEWLSAQTGRYYRLPTEAEWEYACRAENPDAFCFGNQPGQLDEHAWTIGNSHYSYQKVGQKTPNAWGIHDMHGNVAEWCLDAYLPEAYERWQAGSIDPWHPATATFPRVVRGGSFEDKKPAAAMRSGARAYSSPSWNALDPRSPKSIWYLSSKQSVGFRIVRPLEVPDVETMHLMWNTGPGE